MLLALAEMRLAFYFRSEDSQVFLKRCYLTIINKKNFIQWKNGLLLWLCLKKSIGP